MLFFPDIEKLMDSPQSVHYYDKHGSVTMDLDISPASTGKNFLLLTHIYFNLQTLISPDTLACKKLLFCNINIGSAQTLNLCLDFENT